MTEFDVYMAKLYAIVRVQLARQKLSADKRAVHQAYVHILRVANAKRVIVSEKLGVQIFEQMARRRRRSRQKKTPRLPRGQLFPPSPGHAASTPRPDHTASPAGPAATAASPARVGVPAPPATC